MYTTTSTRLFNLLCRSVRLCHLLLKTFILEVLTNCIETIEPHVIHTTQPIHEVHHNSAQHHASTALPAVSMEEFKKQGGTLGGRETRHGEVDGCPPEDFGTHRDHGHKARDSGVAGVASGGAAAAESRRRSGSSSSSDQESKTRSKTGAGIAAAAGAGSVPNESTPNENTDPLT